MSSKNTKNKEYLEQTDEQLAEKCGLHDEMAFQELMRRYMRPIFNFARQYAKTTEDTEDVAQDTFYKVWKYIKKYTRGRQFRPWLYTIARNTALDYIKKKKASAFSDLDDDENNLLFADTLEDTEPLQPEIFHSAMLAEKVTAAMQNIHPDHRAVLVMHYKEEMTFDEIAEVMKRPMNTVKSWHRRALMQLREMLSHHAPQ